MVRALPKKKAHADKNKGTEPLDRKNKEKQKTVEDDSTSVRKKYFKELPGGVLPEKGNPNSEKDSNNDEATVVLELEKQFERNHPPKLTPYPRRRVYGITNPPNGPPTRGGGERYRFAIRKLSQGYVGGDDPF